MITGYEFNGRFMQGFYLFLTMSKEVLVPNHTTLVATLSAVSGVAILGKGKWIRCLMVKGGFELESKDSYPYVMWVGNLEESKGTIESMPMEPNKYILCGSRNIGNINISEYAAKRLIEWAPDTAECFAVLSNMYAAAG